MAESFDWGDTPQHERNFSDPTWSDEERRARLTGLRDELLAEHPDYAATILEVDLSGPFAALGLIGLSGSLSGKGVTAEISQTDAAGRTEVIGHTLNYSSTGEPGTVVYTQTPDDALSDEHAAVVASLAMPVDMDAALRDFIG